MANTIQTIVNIHTLTSTKNGILTLTQQGDDQFLAQLTVEDPDNNLTNSNLFSFSEVARFLARADTLFLCGQLVFVCFVQ